MNLLNNDYVVDKFKNLKVGALFMEMGTGKTKTILDIYNIKDIDSKIIWVTPASLIRSTKNEIEKWYPKLLIKILFFSSESISQSDNQYLNIHKILLNSKCFLVIDESIKFKNLTSKRTKRLVEISQLAEHRFILNGTPITRSILDLLAQMNILSPKILNMSESEFANRYLIYRLDNGSMAPWRSWSKPANEEALLSKINPYIIESNLDIDINFEEKRYQCYLSTDEEISYREFKNDILENNGNLDFFSVSQRFQQFYSKNNHKIEKIKELHQPKTIYFVKYLFWFDLLHSLFGSNVGIYNSLQKDELENFDTAIITYGCGAFGLNLQMYNRIVFVDATFDYGQKIQAISRIRRYGQKNNIEIVDLYVNTGLDYIIEKSLSKKNSSYQYVKMLINKMSREELLCL